MPNCTSKTETVYTLSLTEDEARALFWAISASAAEDNADAGMAPKNARRIAEQVEELLEEALRDNGVAP